MQPNQFNFTYRPELHLASVAEIPEYASHAPTRAVTFLQHPGKRQAAVSAYIAARISRSADPIEQIAEEVLLKGDEEASEALAKIFHGYGHASVADQAVLTVVLENIPQFTAHKIFNILSAVAGQERSTRYQQFDQDGYQYVRPPSHWPSGLREMYGEIMQRWAKLYRKFEDPTKVALRKHFQLEAKHEKVLQSRTLDCTRYFLPLGSKTSMVIIASARTFSSLIGLLKGSAQVEEQRVAWLLELLLTKEANGATVDCLEYLPEAASLIRHVEPNSVTSKATRQVIDSYREARPDMGSYFSGDEPVDYNFRAIKAQPVHEALIKHLFSLIHPKLVVRDPGILPWELAKISGPLFSAHDRHHSMGNLGQMGAICFEGVADIGSLRDINRHRSFERWLPYLDDNYNLIADLNANPVYALCPYLYLKGYKELQESYHTSFSWQYARINGWVDSAQQAGLDNAEILEYGRYLLPLAHQGQYFFYCSIDDLQYLADLRTRPGGHIQYRMLTKQWIERLCRPVEPDSYFWRPLYDKLVDVDPASREQFLDRS